MNQLCIELDECGFCKKNGFCKHCGYCYDDCEFCKEYDECDRLEKEEL